MLCRGFAAIRWSLGLLAVSFLVAQAVLAAPSPEATMEAISTAVDRGDGAAFTHLVNVDGILNDAITALATEAAKPENASQWPPMLALLFSQAAAQAQIRQLLLHEARAFVLNGVTSGAFAGKQLTPSQLQGVLAPLFANASLGRKEIHDLGAPLLQDDGTWLMTFSVRDHGNDREYGVVGRFAAATPDSEELRLDGVVNLPQLMEQIRQEAEQGD